MDGVVISIRIERDLAERLDQLVQDCQESRDELLAEAVRQYVDEQSDLIAAIKEGEADIAAGRYSTHDEVIEDLRDAFARKNAA